MLEKLLLLLFVISPCWASAQRISIKSEPASFTKVMAYEAPTKTEIDTMLKLCLQYIFKNADTCLIIAERALEHGEQFYPGDTIHAECLLFLGDARRSRNEWEPAIKALISGRDICRKLGLESLAAAAELKLGVVSTRIGEYEKALDYHLSALATWERLEDSSNVFKPWFEIAEVFYLMKQPRKALEYNGKALAWGKAINAPVITMFALMNQGSIQQELADDFTLATDTTAGGIALSQDSVLYYRQSALASYTQAMPETRKRGGNRSIANLLTNLVDLKADLGQYAEALVLATEAEELTERLNAHELRLANSINLVKIYRLTGNLAQAVEVANIGLENPATAQNATLQNSLQEELYLAYKGLGQFKEALVYQEIVTDFKLENEASERTEIVASVEAKYQAGRKEKQILELSVANAAIQRKSYLYMLSAGLLTLFGFLGFQLTRIRRERNQKAAFTDALIDAQEDERKRIARDLHDGIGQSLLVIKQQFEANKNSTLENQRLISATLEEVRTISRDLHPVLLEKFGITATMKDIVEQVATTAADLFVSSEIADIDGLLSAKAELQIYRTVQEALSNVVKHAVATAAKVTISQSANFVDVLIQDNGKGFDYELAVARSRSLGLRTMFERISSTGGKFSIKSTPGSGTEIQVKVPIREKD